MTIRIATLDDISAIQKLNHDLFLTDNEFNQDLDLDWPNTEEGVQYYTEAVNSERFLSIVAEENGKVIGYLNGYIRKPSMIYKGVRAELDNMCVSEAARNKGVGSALMAEFKKWAKEKGAERLMVEAFSKNERALAFYAKNGFEPYATILTQTIE